jgi:hypothetical protein
VLEGVHGAGRFRVGGQEGALAGGGYVVDVGTGEQARGGEQQPGADRDPAPA